MRPDNSFKLLNWQLSIVPYKIKGSPFSQHFATSLLSGTIAFAITWNNVYIFKIDSTNNLTHKKPKIG